MPGDGSSGGLDDRGGIASSNGGGIGSCNVGGIGSCNGGGVISHCRGGSDGGCGVVSHCWGGSVVSQGGGGRVGQSVIADSEVGLADAGEWSVDGLGVGGHLSEVSVAPQDVRVLGGDGGGGDGSGGCVSDGGGGSITHSGGPDYTGVGGSHESGEDQYLRLENCRKDAETVQRAVGMHLRLVTHFDLAKYLFYLSVVKTVATQTCIYSSDQVTR